MIKLVISAGILMLIGYSVQANELGRSSGSFQEWPFITVWKTDNPGVSASNQIRIPGTGTDYLIEWQEVGNPGNSGKEAGSGTHTVTFPLPGTYIVEISGDFTRINFGLANAQAGDRTKIIDIVQWGDIKWSSMENAFRNAVNMDLTAKDAPDLSRVASMSLMFMGTTFNRDLGNWNVSTVTNMTGLFRAATSFNGDLSSWDVSNVTTMWQMFFGATSFNGQINNWDVGSVNDMRSMFRDAASFNQDIGAWDVSGVTTMFELFHGATSFNGNISNWNVGNVTNMASMFQGAANFNGDLSGWNVSQVTDMSRMFQGAAIFNGDIGKWDVGNVTHMTLMFRDARIFNSDLSNWNVGNVTDMGGMLLNAHEFNGDLSRWDVRNVTSMATMFDGAINFNGDISTWDVGNVTNMASMFFRALAFNSDISGWNVENVTNMRQMFRAANSFNRDLSEWDMSSVTTASGMFRNATSFNGNLSGWNLGSLTDTFEMFQGAEAFNGDISGWNLSNVTDMRFMFDGAISFNQDVSGWDVSNVTMMSILFRNARSFNQDLSGWNVSKVTVMSAMLDSTAVSVQNYDALLSAWSKLDLRQGVRLGAAGLSYCASSEERQALIDNFGWIISGDTETGSCFITEPELMVWPGDTNNDGTVTAADVLPIGLYYGLNGPVRNQDYNPLWMGQTAELWAEADATWADATGDGRIDQNDLLPIGLNFGKSNVEIGLDQIQSDPVFFEYYLDPGPAGTERVLQLQVGTDEAIGSEGGLLGFSAEVIYPRANMVLSEVRPGSAIDHEKLISFRKDLPGKEGTGIAYTRVRGSEPSTAHGVLAEITFGYSEILTKPVKIIFRDLWISDTGTLARAEPGIFLITVTSDNESTDPAIPAEFLLYQNYPNPFNPATSIQYSLAADTEVRLEVFNLMGQRVALLDHGFKPAGSYSVTFDASYAASGVYIYRLTTPQFNQIRKMVLIK